MPSMKAPIDARVSASGADPDDYPELLKLLALPAADRLRLAELLEADLPAAPGPGVQDGLRPGKADGEE